ncbi:MAG: hypothetical protein ACLSX0_01385 [Anaerostipes caccae]|jgi:pilus assembly protein TadC
MKLLFLISSFLFVALILFIALKQFHKYNRGEIKFPLFVSRLEECLKLLKILYDIFGK